LVNHVINKVNVNGFYRKIGVNSNGALAGLIGGRIAAISWEILKNISARLHHNWYGDVLDIVIRS
jgi:hypothetical protein